MYSSCEEEEYRFFDAHDSIGSVDSVPDPVSEPDESSHGVDDDDDDDGDDDSVPTNFQYDIWTNAPTSVLQRKHTFLRLMGLSSDDNILYDENTVVDDVEIGGIDIETDDRIMQTSGAVLRTPIEEEEQQQKEESPVSSSNSGWCDDSTCSSSTVTRTEDSNGGGECKEEEDGKKLLAKADIIPAPVVLKFADRLKVAGTMVKTMNKVKGQFLGRLRSITSRQGRSDSLRFRDAGSPAPPPTPPPEPHWGKVQRIRVRQNRKRLKELSAVFNGQDIQAHDGSILTMKFSLDGRYLASAGEDMVIRIWKIVEDERSEDIDIPAVDPSCLYFTVNNNSELAPLTAEKEKQKLSRMKSMRKTKNSACVIFPPKVFRISENPVHEFHGHKGHVLDLSWSNDNFLLSSSVDETVRLWKIGSDECLKVFPHSNYVTCVEFQPLDQNYFISGSIDGKVRMWSVSKCQVVDWIDLREIVTAVAYIPDGTGGVIGSMTGCCSFFTLPENRFQLEESVCINSRKTSQRIIGFQYCPQDPSKVMVTCADSQIRILHGINVVGKFKAQRSTSNPICATFTSNGKHIISANEDSNVYIWNCYDQKGSSFDQNKTVNSYECFAASASVAVPWSGFTGGGEDAEEWWCRSLPASHFSQFFTESIPKGSATWPEENLPATSSPSAMSLSSPLCKSSYKFIQSSCSYNCHTWGLVVVTAGWDGRIRSFLNYGLPTTV